MSEMAQRDLDAALQLLADRAQYITGAGGAAIALRRSGKNDMLCRASTGSNAPELGALLSTEAGLSGESVRTRQPLRCDDAALDARVNREVCRRMGIASVAVMPVVQDDEVLGVFELFSGKPGAFADRDLSALRRLSEMVETAVRLARAAESLPELKLADPAAEAATPGLLETPDPGVKTIPDPAAETISEPTRDAVVEAEIETIPELSSVTSTEIPAVAEPPGESGRESQGPVVPAASKRPLFWWAAQKANAETEKPAEPDQSHVPPMLRNLRKCEACGFPVSARRVLCVECEEKRWRGQLRTPQAAERLSSGNTAVSASAPRAFAAAAHSISVLPPASAARTPTPAVPPKSALDSSVSELLTEHVQTTSPAAAPDLVFGAALQPSQS